MKYFIFKSIVAIVIAFGIASFSSLNPFWFLTGWFGADLMLYLAGQYD